jgi:transposase
VKAFIQKKQVKHFTIVADAAMISAQNIQELKKEGIHYIVGARLGNLPKSLFEELDAKIKREDGNIVRLHTDKGYLICSFSIARQKKTKRSWKNKFSKLKVL